MIVTDQEFIMPSIVGCDQFYNPTTNKWLRLEEEHRRIWSYLNGCTPDNPDGDMRKGFKVSQAVISDVCRIEKHVITRFLTTLTNAGYIKKSANFLPRQRVENTYSILKPLIVREDPRWADIRMLQQRSEYA